jgi:hypothetical protein
VFMSIHRGEGSVQLTHDSGLKLRCFFFFYLFNYIVPQLGRMLVKVTTCAKSLYKASSTIGNIPRYEFLGKTNE